MTIFGICQKHLRLYGGSGKTEISFNMLGLSICVCVCVCVCVCPSLSDTQSERERENFSAEHEGTPSTQQ